MRCVFNGGDTQVPQFDVHVAAKLRRLSCDPTPTVLDLFSGCGGFSLGFHSAGHRLIGAVEVDEHAARSHAANFFADDSLHAKNHDITCLDPLEFVGSLAPGADPRQAVDILIGGPPCQAFARIGRAKLREVLDHPEAFQLDPRVGLYESYLHFVRELRPVALVMENVIDILNHAGRNIPEEICSVLEELGYACRYTTLNAVHYGVPQMRERFFLMGTHQALGVTPSFPEPTHFWKLPSGYDGARNIAFQTLGRSASERYVRVPGRGTQRAVTAEEALQDLPPFTRHKTGQLRKGPARYDTLARYREDVEPTEYGRLMRMWPGFTSQEGVYDHLIRFLPRDYDIFERMRPGDQYPEAWQIGLELREHRLAQARDDVKARFSATDPRRQAALADLEPGGVEHARIEKATLPPYDPGKFPNKWRKMEPDRPARTLMAHLGKDSYTHIHYDDSEKRTISIREAARLQSFPDGFVFRGAMNPAFRQIGNAVPPLLARALGEELLRIIRGGLQKATAGSDLREMALVP